MGATRDDEELHPEDRAWQRERFAAGALIFGSIGVVASPLLLGLALGPIGMRAGLDLWRAGIRRPVVAAGVLMSLVATAASILAAVAWGALLMQVLLSRDVLRETEKWRGQSIAQTTVAVRDESGVAERSLVPGEGDRRLVLLFVDPGTAPSAEAVRTLAHACGRWPQVAILVVGVSTDAIATRDFVLAQGLDVAVVDPASPLPSPLDAVFALPTMVVVDTEGRIESAVVGSRSLDEVERLLEGPDPGRIAPASPVP